jgi:hypothetical protein
MWSGIASTLQASEDARNHWDQGACVMRMYDQLSPHISKSGEKVNSVCAPLASIGALLVSPRMRDETRCRKKARTEIT